MPPLPDLQSQNVGGFERDAINEPRLADYVAIARRRMGWIVVPIVASLAIAAIWADRQPDEFEATSRVLLAPTAAGSVVAEDQNTQAAATRDLTNAALFAEGDRALDFVQGRHGTTVAEASVRITTQVDADVVAFTARSSDATQAANIANAWADSFVELRLLDGTESAIAVRTDLESRVGELHARHADSDLTDTDRLLVQSEINALSNWITQLDTFIQIVADSAGQVVQKAQPPTQSTNMPLTRTLTLAGIIGLILGLAMALLRDHLDRGVRSNGDLRRLGITPLGEIPKAARARRNDNLATEIVTHPHSPISAAFRRAVTMVGMEARIHEARSILITSALANEGKSTSAANLALGFAESTDIVALVDADLRRPSVANAFGLDDHEHGLTSAIGDQANLEDIPHEIETGNGTLAIITAGPQVTRPSSWLASDRMKWLVNTFEVEADMTIFDGPPVLPVSDALSLAPLVGGVVLAVDAGRTRIDELEATRRAVEATGAKVLGALLVGVGHRHIASSYSDTQPPPSGEMAIDLTADNPLPKVDGTVRQNQTIG